MIISEDQKNEINKITRIRRNFNIHDLKNDFLCKRINNKSAIIIYPSTIEAQIICLVVILNSSITLAFGKGGSNEYPIIKPNIIADKNASNGIPYIFSSLLQKK